MQHESDAAGMEAGMLTTPCHPSVASVWANLARDARRRVRLACLDQFPWVRVDIATWSVYRQWTHNRRRVRQARRRELLSDIPSGPCGLWSRMGRTGNVRWRPHLLSEIFLVDAFEQLAIRRDGRVRRVPVLILWSGPWDVLLVAFGNTGRYIVQAPSRSDPARAQNFLDDLTGKRLAGPHQATSRYHVL